MVVVGCVSALLFLVLNAYAPELRGAGDGGEHALSRSAVGFAGLARLLADEGVPTRMSRNPHPERDPQSSLLVLTPSLTSDPKSVGRIAGSGVELIILPKWLSVPDPTHPGWVLRGDLAPQNMIEDRLLHQWDTGDHIVRRTGPFRPTMTSVAKCPSAGAAVTTGTIENLQTIAGPDKGWEAVAVDQDGEAVLIKQAGLEVYILSDPDLLNNHGLAELANARWASALIGALRAEQSTSDGAALPVAFDLTLAGFGRTRSLLTLAFEPPFLAATLCAIAAAGLMGLHAAGRFGAPLRQGPTFALGKRALADNSAALIRLVRREHRMGAGYAALTRELAATAVGAPRDLDDGQLDALLDRMGGAKQASAAFSDLERAAREARDTPALLGAARRLYQWRLEMTHERR
jgi:hypothetical protein